MTHRNPLNQKNKIKPENNELEKPILLKHIAYTFFQYCDFERPDLRNKSSPLTINQIYVEYLLTQLLLHVVRGELAQAAAIIKTNPELLFESGRVIDYSGRTIEGTALQMALGAEDIEMCEVIIHHLDKLNKKEKLIQYQKQFPADDKKIYSALSDIEALDKVFQAISDSKTDEECEPALKAFRKYLEPQGVIKSGKHFNVELLIAALKLFNAKYSLLGGWDKDKRKVKLFWCKVIGYIQRFLPACYAHVFSQGLYYVVEYNEKLNRSLKFRYNDQVYHYPLDLNLNYQLGFDYAREWASRDDPICSVYPGGHAGWTCRALEKLYRTKTVALQNLKKDIVDSTLHRCLVM